MSTRAMRVGASLLACLTEPVMMNGVTPCFAGVEALGMKASRSVFGPSTPLSCPTPSVATEEPETGCADEWEKYEEAVQKADNLPRARDCDKKTLRSKLAWLKEATKDLKSWKIKNCATMAEDRRAKDEAKKILWALLDVVQASNADDTIKRDAAIEARTCTIIHGSISLPADFKERVAEVPASASGSYNPCEEEVPRFIMQLCVVVFVSALGFWVCYKILSCIGKAIADELEKHDGMKHDLFLFMFGFWLLIGSGCCIIGGKPFEGAGFLGAGVVSFVYFIKGDKPEDLALPKLCHGVDAVNDKLPK